MGRRLVFFYMTKWYFCYNVFWWVSGCRLVVSLFWFYFVLGCSSLRFAGFSSMVPFGVFDEWGVQIRAVRQGRFPFWGKDGKDFTSLILSGMPACLSAYRIDLCSSTLSWVGD